MLENPNEPVSDLSYFDCLESVMENSKVSQSLLVTLLSTEITYLTKQPKEGRLPFGLNLTVQPDGRIMRQSVTLHLQSGSRDRGVQVFSSISPVYKV